MRASFLRVPTTPALWGCVSSGSFPITANFSDLPCGWTLGLSVEVGTGGEGVTVLLQARPQLYVGADHLEVLLCACPHAYRLSRSKQGRLILTVGREGLRVRQEAAVRQAGLGLNPRVVAATEHRRGQRVLASLDRGPALEPLPEVPLPVLGPSPAVVWPSGAALVGSYPQAPRHLLQSLAHAVGHQCLVEPLLVRKRSVLRPVSEQRLQLSRVGVQGLRDHPDDPREIGYPLREHERTGALDPRHVEVQEQQQGRGREGQGRCPPTFFLLFRPTRPTLLICVQEVPLPLQYPARRDGPPQGLEQRAQPPLQGGRVRERGFGGQAQVG